MADDAQDRILAALARSGVAPGDLALILLTHGHGDHAGSALALRAATGAPIAMHAADATLTRHGRNGALPSTRWSSSVLRPLVDRPYPPFEPDLVLSDGMSLIRHGVDGTVLHTPGHTAGSILPVP